MERRGKSRTLRVFGLASVALGFVALVLFVVFVVRSGWNFGNASLGIGALSCLCGGSGLLLQAAALFRREAGQSAAD